MNPRNERTQYLPEIIIATALVLVSLYAVFVVLPSLVIGG